MSTNNMGAGPSNGPKSALDTEDRWEDAAIRATVQVNRQAAASGRNTPKERWKRAIYLASRLADANTILQYGQTYDESTLQDKHMETQHWLELIDGKHRYGSNLKWYHHRWQTEDTTENFFKWLDRGGGKELSLEECSREQLEKERIQYLSAEQRLNYLADVDPSGKLRWHHNKELVDTTAGRWKDTGGHGIVPEDGLPADKPIVNRTGSFGSISRSSSTVDENGTHYLGKVKGKNPITRTLWKYFTASGTMNRLLRKTVKRNSWIYVTDKNFNMFIGIKEPGAFQHSSFLAGGLVTSAGLITVKSGVIHKLSPLSGHYRTTSDHFQQLLKALSTKGVDMHKAKTYEGLMALWGVEQMAKVGKKKKAAQEDVKQAGLTLTRSTTKWKREILEGRPHKPDTEEPAKAQAEHS